jgi:hypothetical protein
MKLSATAPYLTQIALQQGMSVEADRVWVDETVDRIFLQQRAERVNLSRIEPIKVCELPDFDLKSVERLALILTRMDQDRHRMAKRDVREAIRRIFDEAPARKRQRSNETVTQKIMKHRRASPRRVIADLLLGFDHGHPRMLGKGRSGGKPRDSAADH